MLTRTMPDDGPRELNSWKEIAAHLQVTVRTAQEWEKKRGLPVRRVPGGRGRVFVRLDELEAWLTQDGLSGAADRQPNTPQAPAAAPARTVPERSWLPWLTVASASAALLLAITAVIIVVTDGAAPVSPPSPKPTPSQTRVIGNRLIVQDDQGEELWSREFDEGLLTQTYELEGVRHAEFVDLNEDGSLELLFVLRPAELASSHSLVCFDAEGNELWRYTARASIRTATETFGNIYHTATFMPVDLSDGSNGIVLSSLHYPHYPTQLALISATDGSLLAEYWHSGHIAQRPELLKVGDLDNDGRLELYAGGISNAHDRATLIVLDLQTMRGASVEEDPAYQIQGFGPPNEIVRILFPRSSMNLAMSDDYNTTLRISLTDEYISVAVLESFLDPLGPALFYRLLPDFSLFDVKSSTGFDGLHNRLFREGILTISLEEELASLPPLRYVGKSPVLTSGQ